MCRATVAPDRGIVGSSRFGRSLRLFQAALTYCFGLGLVMVAALYIALNGTRARLLEAGHQERQRLECNLHDGAHSGWSPSRSS